MASIPRKAEPVPAMPPLRGALRDQQAAIPVMQPDDHLVVPELPPGWMPLDDVPRNRAIFLACNPPPGHHGVLAYWRTTRVKVNGKRGWQVASYWASVLNARRLDFEPNAWREAAPGLHKQAEAAE